MASPQFIEKIPENADNQLASSKIVVWCSCGRVVDSAYLYQQEYILFER